MKLISHHFSRAQLIPTLAKLTLGIAALSCASCVAPIQTNASHYALDPAVAQQNRAFTQALEEEGQEFLHRERMNRAAEIELATRNAPKVIHHTRIYAPRCCW